jgi:hypothetical protein
MSLLGKIPNSVRITMELRNNRNSSIGPIDAPLRNNKLLFYAGVK